MIDTRHAPSTPDTPTSSLTQTNYAPIAGERGGAFQDQISWRAILAGTVIALISSLILNVLGVAFAASSSGPGPWRGPFVDMSNGMGIWFTVANIISFYLGGWVTGMFIGVQRRSISMVHALVTFGLASFLGLSLVTGATSGLMGSVGMNAPAPGANAPDVGTLMASTAARTAWWTFVSLVLSAAASAIGANNAERREEKETQRHYGVGTAHPAM